MDKEKTNNRAPEPLDLITPLQGLLVQLRRFWWVVLLLGLLGGGVMYWNSLQTYVPMYKAEAVFSITIQNSGSTDINSAGYYYDNEAAQLAAESFPFVLASDVMTERIKLALGTDRINGRIESASIDGTNFLVLSARSRDPYTAYELVQTVVALYPQISASVLGDTQMIVSQMPSVPTTPYNSFTWQKNTAIGAGVGAALGLGILLILQLVNQTVSTAEDVKKLVNLPCIGQIPNVRQKQRKKGQPQKLLLSEMEPDAPFCEAFRLLRLKLLRQLTAPRHKIILFTSTLPSEGKSSLALNTAFSLARDGKKVLLIDGDLRVQNIKNMLDLTESTRGLTECLSGTTDELQIRRYRDTGLYLCAGDGACANPIPLLKHGRLRVILEALRKKFDYIILDTPPVGMMADAAMLARYSDKVVYVIREDYASKSQILDGIQALTDSGASICGFVLNRTGDGSGSRYGYGYGYGYGKKYGYGYGKKYGYGYGYSRTPKDKEEDE